MGDKRTKQRITSKIDELPEDLRMKVDVMLADTSNTYAVSYTHLRAHETRHDLVCRLLLEKKKTSP